MEANKDKLNVPTLDEEKQLTTPSATVKIDFISPELKVTIQTTKRNYAKVA